jgi:hypothetical protein
MERFLACRPCSGVGSNLGKSALVGDRAKECFLPVGGELNKEKPGTSRLPRDQRGLSIDCQAGEAGMPSDEIEDWNVDLLGDGMSSGSSSSASSSPSPTLS